MSTTPPTFPISKASFTSNIFTFDPLYASDTISQSAKIAGGLGLLTRGTVLMGPNAGLPITTATLLTTVVTGAQARCILAQDIDTTGGPVTGLVYTAGNFLDTAMTFTSQGAALDAAQLWVFDNHVMTVEQRSGLLVPMMNLPTTGGPLPQSLSSKEAVQVSKEQVDAIRAVMAALPGGLPASTGPAKDPAWAIAAFGEPEPSKEEQAKEKAAEESEELTEKQTKALDELKAKQQKELSDFLKKQQEERAHLIKREAEALKQARANTAKEAPSTAPPPKK